MDFNAQRVLGRTGLKVGRLGVGSSYGAPAEAFEEAFERGCNYFYWGSMRRTGMCQAIKNICRKGKRDELIVVIQSYSRSAFLLEVFYRRALKLLALDHADILLLGWYRKKPPQKILNKVIPELAKENIFDIFHIRYSAAHRGAESETFPYLEEENRPGIVSYTATRWGHLLQEKNMPPGESAPAASDCYRFVLSHPAVDVCMTGPKNLQQMRQALRTLDLGPLGGDELERMRRIGDHIRR
jgi:aryl-alcohol dehydrogenase-like predicted oxidoreductase